MSCISSIYFFSLLFLLPLIITIIGILIFLFLSFKLFFQNTLNDNPNKDFPTILSFLVLFLGVFLVVNRGFYLSEKYGDWDAWAFWNIHAKFLSIPNHWNLFLNNNADAHPDYPLCLPGTIAFIWRLISSNSFLIPFAISSFVSITIPIVLFLELNKKNFFVATLILFWFVTDDYYVSHSLFQYADYLLSFYFLFSFIVIGYYRDTFDKKYLVIAGLLLGSCLWTKNEGILLFIVVLIFNFDLVLNIKTAKYLFFGLLIPLSAFLIFKFGYAPTNDLVGKRENISLGFLTSKSRIEIIKSSFIENINMNFYYYKWAALLLVPIGFVNQYFPIRNLLIIFSCLAGFFIVFLLTPQDLTWHVKYSMDRILSQLAPAFSYLIGLELSKVFNKYQLTIVSKH